MLSKLFKYKWIIGVCAVILGLVGWFVKTSMKEAVQPMYHEIIVLLNVASKERAGMNNKIIQMDAQYNALDLRVTKGFKYQNDVLRVEVKDNAQNKEDKTDAKDDIKTMEERMDAIEIADQIHGLRSKDAQK